MAVYYVSSANTTDIEAAPGWYAIKQTDDCCGEERAGPFLTEAEALDWESNGAYSDYIGSLSRERREMRDLEDFGSYREQMLSAGRGHLLRDDD